MINVEIYAQSDRKVTGFSIEGHSGTALRGSDIICAGVSTVAQAAYFCITKHLQREVDGDFDNGKLSLKLKTPPDEITEAVFWTMMIGIVNTKKLAPDAVKFKVIKVGERCDLRKMRTIFSRGRRC